MDQTLFGLNRIPFTALPRGADVFIGPQTAGLVQAFRSALETPDAIVTVSGPAGIGKTTLVNYALDGLYRKKKIARLGRASLRSQDVLASLLIVLGVTNRPSDRDHGLVILRDALQQYAAAQVSVIVVVEDALNAGAEVLAEFAALTLAGTNGSTGARMILMGSGALPHFLQRHELDNLRERVSLQHDLSELSAAETRGYLLHCFRTAGGNFDQLFAPECSDLLHSISDGNPRAINQLTEVVLRTAAAMNATQITPRFIAKVAAQIYDPELHDFKFVNSTTDVDAPVNEPAEDIADASDQSAADDEPGTIEAEIMKADCLEDLDDVMAETLFGTEVSDLAAQATGTGK